MPITPNQVRRFGRLFQGYEHAHGVFLPGRTAENGKAEGKSSTVLGAAQEEDYQEHLRGTKGLGVVMLMQDTSVYFGAIDHDDRRMDHALAWERIQKLGLPLVLCRSKSGGGHFYCFCSEPVPATLMRERLAEWVALLGMAATTEQFPKQVSRFSGEDVGSWINLPYFNADSTNRYAIGPNNTHLPLEDFLTLAEMSMQSESSLQNPQLKPDSDYFLEGPPCLQRIEQLGGLEEGNRNNGLSNMIVYLKMRYPDTWRNFVYEYNEKFVGLGQTEVLRTMNSFEKKEYYYMCKKAPINAYCQSRLCARRQYGVNNSENVQGNGSHPGIEITGVTQYKTPQGDGLYWGIEVNGVRVMVTTSEFYNISQFNQRCMDVLGRVASNIRQAKWVDYVAELCSHAGQAMVPEDASAAGQMSEWVSAFLHEAHRASTWEGLLNGGSIYIEGDRAYFRSTDLFDHFGKYHVRVTSSFWVWDKLKQMRGVDKHQKWLRGKTVSLWSLPIEQGEPGPTKPATFERDEEF